MPEGQMDLGEEAKAGKESNKRDTLSDIRSVGSDKQLGYLPLSFISREGETPEHLIAEAEVKGLSHTITDLDEYGSSRSLYVFDKDTLQKLLDSRKAVLEQVNWPTQADQFVEHIAKNNAPQETDLFDLVADAFADYFNPGRKLFPKPLTTKQRLGITLTKIMSSG